jgi:hypothetical protein
MILPMRRIFFSPNFPATDDDLAEAAAAGAAEVVQGEGGYREVAEYGDAHAEQVEMALARLAARRERALAAFRAVVAGTEYAMPLTRDTRADIAEAERFLKRQGAGARVDWEIADGVWLALTLDDLTGLADAAGHWAQACYSASRRIAGAIAAAEAPLLADLEAGWPA